MWIDIRKEKVKIFHGNRTYELNDVFGSMGEQITFGKIFQPESGWKYICRLTDIFLSHRRRTPYFNAVYRNDYLLVAFFKHIINKFLHDSHDEDLFVIVSDYYNASVRALILSAAHHANFNNIKIISLSDFYLLNSVPKKENILYVDLGCYGLELAYKYQLQCGTYMLKQSFYGSINTGHIINNLYHLVANKAKLIPPKGVFYKELSYFAYLVHCKLRNAWNDLKTNRKYWLVYDRFMLWNRAKANIDIVITPENIQWEVNKLTQRIIKILEENLNTLKHQGITTDCIAFTGELSYENILSAELVDFANKKNISYKFVDFSDNTCSRGKAIDNNKLSGFQDLNYYLVIGNPQDRLYPLFKAEKFEQREWEDVFCLNNEGRAINIKIVSCDRDQNKQVEEIVWEKEILVKKDLNIFIKFVLNKDGIWEIISPDIETDLDMINYNNEFNLKDIVVWEGKEEKERYLPFTNKNKR